MEAVELSQESRDLGTISVRASNSEWEVAGFDRVDRTNHR